MENTEDLDLDLDVEPKPKAREMSYISTGWTEYDKSFVLLQDMQNLVTEKLDMTALELLTQVEQLVNAAKLKCLKREARRHQRKLDKDDE